MLDIITAPALQQKEQHWRGTKMPTVWFIRHGESEANAGLPTIDPVRVKLTARGREQADHVAGSFHRPPSSIVTSSYERAKETAAPTRRRFPHAGYEEWETLREFTYLALTEKQQTTKRDRQPLVDAYWERLDPCYTDGADVESFRQFIGRVYSALESLKHCHTDFIAVFSHEQFIMAACWLLMTQPKLLNAQAMQYFRYFLCMHPLANGAIMQVKFRDDGEIPCINVMDEHL